MSTDAPPRAADRADATAGSGREFVLAAMPWMKPDHVSIQLGILKSALTERNPDLEFDVTARHYYKDVLSYVPGDVYETVYFSNTGEYFALCLLYPDQREEILAYVDEQCPDVDTRKFLGVFDEFVDDVVDELAGLSPTGVGFTTSLFQTITSIAVARRLVDRRPDVDVVLGGASLTRNMAERLLGTFDCVDVVVRGEGERVLAQVFDAQRRGAVPEDLTDVPNLTYRAGNVVHSTDDADPLDMTALPTGDYDDYFDHALVDDDLGIYPKIPVETSRGCFYGECDYCNLNQQWGVKYRGKDAQATYEEIRELVERYRTTRLLFVDTNISNRHNLLEKLAADDVDYECWAEVSAHTKRGRDMLELMSEAGVRNIQIGIEAFSEDILEIFTKGVTLMRNVEVLKWCEEFDIQLFYNIIVGHPDETDEHVAETREVMEYVRYFQPPNVATFTLSIESPMYRRMDVVDVEGAWGNNPMLDVLPDPDGQVLTPLLSTIVGYKPTNVEEIYDRWEPVTDYIEEWERIYEDNDEEPGLVLTDAGDFSVVTDRTRTPERQITLEGVARDVYLNCMRRATAYEDLVEAVDADPSEVAGAISFLEEKRILFRHDGECFALAVPKYER